MAYQNESSATAVLHIKLLGEFRVEYGSDLLTAVNTSRQQSLLAYLVLHRDAPQSRQYLAFRFWPDSTEAQARTNLRKQIHYLRRALPESQRFLRSDTQVIQWRPDAPVTLDIAQFESALAIAHASGELGQKSASLRQAVALYDGDLLPSCYDDWIVPERERLHRRFIQALDDLIHSLEDQREYQEAIANAQRLLQHEPLQEATYRRLMRLFALTGDRAQALHTYQTCVAVLEQELGVAPSPRTRETYEHLLEVKDSPVSPPDQPSSGHTFIGRTEEWARLQAEWRDAYGRKPRLVLITGEAGIGKTYLAEALLSWAARQGIATASARCYASGRELAFDPVTAWLRSETVKLKLSALNRMTLTEAARLLPELITEHADLSAPGPLAEGWQRQRFFAALAQAFLAYRRLLLLLDDVQWCDAETLEWLSYLLRTRPSTDQHQLLVLATLRTESRHDDPRLRAFMRELRRRGQLTELNLGPLNHADASALAAAVQGQALDTAIAEVLYRETEGNPLFLVETMRSGLPAADPAGTKVENRWPLAPTVRRIIAGRLAQLSPAARELAGLAATIGREFTYDVLAQASEDDEDGLVQGLDELWQRLIVRELGKNAYDFSHDKIRDVAYLDLSAARRRLLHRRVAQALGKVHRTNIDAVSGQIAFHYEQAGLFEPSIDYYRRAAKRARDVHANDEALSLLKRALELLQAANLQDSQQVEAKVSEGLGDVLLLTGQREEAMEAFQRALQATATESVIERSRLHRKAGLCSTETADRLQAFAIAEETLGKVAVRPSDEWWQEWLEIQFRRMWVDYDLNQPLRIEKLAEEVQPVLQEHGTRQQRSQFLSLLVARNFRRDRYQVSEETLAYVENALAIAYDLGDAAHIAFSHFGLGFALLWFGDLDNAEKELQTGLNLAQQVGNVTLQVQCLIYLSVRFRKSNQVKNVERLVSKSLELIEITPMPQYEALANANRAWIDWKGKRLSDATERGRKALQLWEQAPAFPFKWTALWPLIGAALAQDAILDAIEYAQALLDPAQQRLPDELTELLEAAMSAWDRDHQSSAKDFLDSALRTAKKTNYL